MRCEIPTQYEATKCYLYAVGILVHEETFDEDTKRRTLIARRADNRKLRGDMVYEFDLDGTLLQIS